MARAGRLTAGPMTSRPAVHPQLGKLRSFGAGCGAGLGKRPRCALVGLGCFHRASPILPARSGALVVRSVRVWHRQTAVPTGAPALIQRCCLADLMSRLISTRVRALPSSSWALLSALARALTSSRTESAAWLSISSSVSIWTLNSASCALERRANPRFRTASGSSDGGGSCSQNQRCIKQRRRLISMLP